MPSHADVDPRVLGSGAVTYVGALDTPLLTDSDAFHLARVRRVRDGEAILLGNGEGAIGRFRVGVRRGKKGNEIASLVPDGVLYNQPTPTSRLGVASFLPSTERLSYLIQKVTEVGIDDIYLLSDPSDRRSGERLSESQVERLSRIAREASSQSKRAFLPQLHAVASLAEFRRIHGGRLAICDGAGNSPTLERSIWVIGPESGLIDDAFGSFPRYRLAQDTLRVETAAVVAGSIMVALREGVVLPSR